ncbi:hypothetical protein ODR38_09940 [Pediococcus acidilactici]
MHFISFLWGVSANWHTVILEQKANLGNITYVMMQNLGLELGKAMGLSSSAAVALGTAFSRFSGLGMLLAYVGSFFVLSYSPLKSFILGSPKELWPKKMTEVNKNGMPANSMWLQAIVVSVFIAGISILASITHKEATFFYNVLTSMNAQEQDANGTVQKVVQATPGAISYLSFSYFNKQLQPIAIDGVQPTAENVQTNRWKIWSYEHMYTQLKTNSATRDFLKYMTSQTVQKNLVSDLGYISIHDLAQPDW